MQLMSYGGRLILTFNMQFVFNTNKFLSIMVGFLHNFCNNFILIIFHLNLNSSRNVYVAYYKNIHVKKNDEKEYILIIRTYINCIIHEKSTVLGVTAVVCERKYDVTGAI